MDFFKLDARMVLDGDGKTISDKIGYLNEQLAENVKRIPLNIREFGAIENGITNDTEALKLAGLSGRTVIFNKGTYLVTDSIFMAMGTKFIGLNKEDTVIKLGANVTLFKCTRENIIEKMFIDGMSLPLYSSDIIELSSATLELLPNPVVYGMVNFSVDNIKVRVGNPKDATKVNGTFLHLWTANNDGVNEYRYKEIHSFKVSNIDIAGQLGYFCRGYSYATGTDYAYIGMAKFEKIDITSLAYGWFGSKDETTINDTNYKGIRNVTIDNVLFQCGFDFSKKFAVLTVGHYMITNCVPMDWDHSYNSQKPYSLLYRENIADHGYKIYFNHEYNNPDSLVELLNAPVGYTATQTRDYVLKMLTPYIDITRDTIYTEEQKFMFRSGELNSSAGTYPQWYKMAEFDSNSSLAITDFSFNARYGNSKKGIINFVVSREDVSATNPLTSPSLNIIASPTFNESEFGEFHVTKEVINGIAHYVLYLKLLESTLGFGGYYFARTFPHTQNTTIFDIKPVYLGAKSENPTNLLFIKGAWKYPSSNGVATIIAGSTSILVTHNFGDNAPTDILATAWGDVGNIWISDVKGFTFKVNCKTAPLVDTKVSWKADNL